MKTLNNSQSTTLTSYGKNCVILIVIMINEKKKKKKKLQYSSHYKIKMSPKDLIVFKRKENLCKDQCGWDVGFL